MLGACRRAAALRAGRPALSWRSSSIPRSLRHKLRSLRSALLMLGRSRPFPIWISFAPHSRMSDSRKAANDAAAPTPGPSLEGKGEAMDDPEILALLEFEPMPRKRVVEGAW